MPHLEQALGFEPLQNLDDRRRDTPSSMASVRLEGSRAPPESWRERITPRSWPSS